MKREFNLAGRDPIEMAKIDAIAQAAYNIIDAYYMNVFNVEDEEQKVSALVNILSNLFYYDLNLIELL